MHHMQVLPTAGGSCCLVLAMVTDKLSTPVPSGLAREESGLLPSTTFVFFPRWPVYLSTER
jgi:hypothetical protein